ncbi:unnamed protein product, partial [Soboliphyme baturini]|uniref:acid phosphatase n=1 Tax=Soboliphyme baturini TaxID=241478 RepID=A0A183JAC4_9BILA
YVLRAFHHSPQPSFFLIRAWDRQRRGQRNDDYYMNCYQCSKIFSKLKEITGFPKFKFDKVTIVYDTARHEVKRLTNSQRLHRNLFQKDAEQTLYDLIVKLKDLKASMEFNSTEKSKFKSGSLEENMETDETLKISNVFRGTEDKKYEHDNTILSLMSLLRISNGKVPSFASCLMIELYRNETSNFYVKTLFLNSTSEIPVELRPLGCSSEDCPFDELQTLMKNYVFGLSLPHIDHTDSSATSRT